MPTKPNGADEPTKPAPGAKPDEAAPAPTTGSEGLDWQGFLAKAEKQFEDQPPPMDSNEMDPPAKRHLPTEDPLTEDDGFTVATEEESGPDDEEQAGPTDGAAAERPDDQPPEEEALDSSELERRLQEKETSERELIALKGRMGKKIGDLVKTLKINGLDENGEPLKSEMSEDERKARQDKAIAEVMEDPEGWFDRRLADRLGSAAEELDALQKQQDLVDAQNGGFRAFQARYKITAKAVDWAKGAEGQALREVLESSPRDKAAFERFMETGNKDGITLVLSDAYDRVLARRKGTEVQGRKEIAAARVEKRKATVLPGGARPRPTTRPGVDISKPSNWMKVAEIAKRQGY